MPIKLTREQVISHLANTYPQYSQNYLLTYVEDAEIISGPRYWTEYFDSVEQVIDDYLMYLNCFKH